LNVSQQKKDNLEEIDYLENQLVNLSNCTEDNEINEIRNELASLGYIKVKKGRASQKQKQSKPAHYISSDGFDIYVGKNNIQNDYLTTKFADSSDIWLHTKNIHGSHVIIKRYNREITDNAISEAAALSAYYSKARNSSSVPVDYTEKKNVKKPSGSKPGMVIYYTNRTIYITPDESIIKEIKRVD
jgi:predicted ribosome quality control (RQC) complex YloA/Tae2 family protein